MEQSKISKKLKLIFNSFEGTGHFNAALGLAQILAKRGHEIVFVINESLAKQIESYGFRVIPLKQITDDNAEKFSFSDNPAKDFGKSLDDTGIFSNKTSLEKENAFQELEVNEFLEGWKSLMIAFNPQIEKILQDEKPDAWLHDQFLIPPVLKKSKIPWFCICSAAPLSYYDSPTLPPHGSGEF